MEDGFSGYLSNPEYLDGKCLKYAFLFLIDRFTF